MEKSPYPIRQATGGGYSSSESETGTSNSVDGDSTSLASDSASEETSSQGGGTTSDSAVSSVTSTVEKVTVTVTNGTGGGIVDKGTSVTVTAEGAQEGQKFARWVDATGTEVSKDNPYTFNATVDITLTAQYEATKVTLTITDGTITGASSGDAFDWGTVTANEAQAGEKFVRWVDENNEEVSTENPYTFEIKKDTVLKAEYGKIQVKLEVTGGTGAGTFDWGTTVTVQSTEVTGKVFSHWEDADGEFVSDQDPYEFEIQEDTALTAVMVTKVDRPTSVEGLQTLLTDYSSELEKEVVSVQSTIDGSNTSSENGTLETTFYQTGKYINGDIPVSEYSKYSGEQYFGMYNEKYIEATSVTSSSYNKLEQYEIVDTVDDDESEITLTEAKSKYESYGLVTIVSDYLNNQFKEENLEGELETTDLEEETGFKVTLKGHMIEGTFYYVQTLDIDFGIDGFIKKIDYEAKGYVKATWYDDETQSLKPDAVSTKSRSFKYDVTRGAREAVPADLPSKYFITSFDVEFSVRYGSSMTISKDNNKIPLGTSETIYSSSFKMTNVQPATAVEDKTLELVSSSDTSVIEIEKSQNSTKFNAKQVGNTTLTFRSLSGIEKTLDVQVQLFAPKSITITAADKVDKNGQIELSATVSPTNGDQEIEWSVDNNQLAEIVEEGGKVYLKGKNAGFGNVVVTAKSKTKDLSGSDVIATKTIYVSPGEMSLSDLATLLDGRWEHEVGKETSNFVVNFNSAEKTFSVVDTYRTYYRVTCTGKYECTSQDDATFKLWDDLDNLCQKQSDYYVITTSDVVAAEGSKNDSGNPLLATEIQNIHFAIAKDGSKLYLHFVAPSKGGSVQEFELHKVAASE